MALAGAAVATALIRGRMLSRMRHVVRADAAEVRKFHPVVGAVPAAIIAHMGPGRSEGGESERAGHAERKLQEQHRTESPSSRARSHGASLHR